MMIDSHCHLDHEPLYKNISEVITRSKKTGISKLLTICTTIKSFENILKLIVSDPIIYGTFGIHPHESEKDTITVEEIINNTKKHNKIIGIGETGLDFFYNHSSHDKQISSFKTHIEASIETNLPLIIHSRDAENETYEILESYKNNKHKIDAKNKDNKDLRTIGLGAQILSDLGVRKMRVLSAPKRIHALSGFGLEVIEYVN